MNFDNESIIAKNSLIEAANVLLDRAKELNVRAKESKRDIVTDYDPKVESKIREYLKRSKHPMVGEESSGDAYIKREGPSWFVDPIDGTINFAHDLHYYALSAGLCQVKHGGSFDWISGAVLIPSLKQSFSTVDAIELSNISRMSEVGLENSVIASCFSSFENDSFKRERHYELFGRLNDASRGCLRLGSAAVQICYTAQGKIQATYGIGCKIWDVAGAMAIASKVGCTIYAKHIKGTNRLNFIVGRKLASQQVKDLIEEMDLCEF